MRYATKWPEYAEQWNKMLIKAGREHEFENLAKFAVIHKDRYVKIENMSHVPWWLVAVLHRRESDANFSTYLGNGDPLNKPTRHVPKGRGPFESFEAGAVDALKLDGLTDVKDWRLEKALYYCEIFNGAGYNNRNLPSPYIWGGTTIQRPGKYVADGQWDSDHWDTQPGCAPILKTISNLDKTVMFIRED